MTKFRFHWGWAIGTFYTLFVVVMVIIVIRSLYVDHSLVVEDYYKYDIEYQAHADKLQNNKSLSEDIVIELSQEAQRLRIQYPVGFNTFSGEILFYRPDNKKLDFKIEVSPGDDLIQSVDLKDIVPGYWRLKINWAGDGKEFYKEHAFYLGVP